jgi:hypothetical protein
LLRLRVREGAAYHLAVGGEQAVIVEGRTQDAEAAVEIGEIVFRIHAGAAEEPDLLNVLPGRESRRGQPAQQQRQRQSRS